MHHDDDTSTGDSLLERHILAGDLDAVMDCIDAADPTERKTMRSAVERLIVRRWQLLRADPASPLTVDGRTDPARANRLFRATELARFMCDPELPASDYWQHIGIQDIASYKARFSPPLSSEPMDRQLRGERGWHYPHHIHRAIVAGLVERPDTDEYIDALFFGDLRQESNLVLKHVDADPGLAPWLLKLFEREGSSEGSFAAREKYCHNPELYWSHAFLTLCERGVYKRAQLLDKTLGALACDWPQFKSGWFSRFHELLAPTVDEMAAEADRYLALCHSRIAPTAGMALQAVAALYKAGRVDALAACEAATPLVSATAKGQVLAALELLGAVATNDAALAHQASAIAAQALGHTAADVHKKAIAFLAKWGLDGAGQDLARSYLPFVSAVNRPALAKLVGEEKTPAGDAPPTTAEPAAAAARVSPLDSSRAIAPITQIPDLVERLAYALENHADVDEWERVAGALVRLAPIAAADKPAFAALQKRAKKMDRNGKYLPFTLARILAAALEGERSPKTAVLEGTKLPDTEHLIGLRTLDLMDQALTGKGLSPLSTPTHRGGFIDPRELVARIQAQQQAGLATSLADQVQALLRLVPAPMDEAAAQTALQRAQAMEPATPLVQALRYALGDAAPTTLPTDDATRPLFLAAARIRSPNADDAGTLAAYGELGPDGPAHARIAWHVESETHSSQYTFHFIYTLPERALQRKEWARPHQTAMALCAKHLPGGDSRRGTEYYAAHIRFAASLLPSGLEPLFAEGVRALGNNLNWYEAEWQNRAYLDLLLEPTTAMGPMARLTLAVALAGKEPGQTALAVDALVHSVQEGRLDRPAMADTLARLWATPLVTGARYAKSLATAAQAGAAMPAAVFLLLCALVEAPASAGRKDLAPLLELLLELHLAHGLALPNSTTAALSAMKLSAKGKAAQQKLLGK